MDYQTTLELLENERKNFIEKYLETFKGVDKYMTDIVEFAKEHGYVETYITEEEVYLKSMQK